MTRCHEKQIAHLVRILCLSTLAACGDSQGDLGSVAGSTDEPVKSPTADELSVDAVPASLPFRGTAISCSQVPQPPRTDEFEVIAETTMPPMQFSKVISNRTHSLVVFPWDENLQVRLTEADGDSLGVKIEILSGTVDPDEYWGVLTLHAQSCWNEAKDAVAFSHVNGSNKTERWSRKNAQSHEIEILLRGNSTYTLGTPGMGATAADSTGSSQ